MAKTESFIAQRLKLVDLIDEVRADFLAGHLGIGHAILIARCDEFKQLDIYNNAQPYREGTPDYGTISEIKDTVEEDTFDLSMASFDKDDKTLIAECSSCTVCTKRSGSNPVLFEDMQDVDRCFDQKCFNKKELAHFHKQVAKIITEAENVVFISGYTKPDDLVLQMCKQFEIKIYGYNDWFAGERENTIEVTAFVVSGSDIGKYKQIWVKSEQSATIQNQESGVGPKNPMTNEEIEAKDEIQKIEARQKRALELDGEKVWAEIRAIKPEDIKNNTEPLFQVEKDALCFAMLKAMGYHSKHDLTKRLALELNIEFTEKGSFTTDQFNIISRTFALDVLPDSFGCHKTVVNNSIYKIMIENYYGKEIKAIEENQNEITENRITKATEKISDLKSKIEKLKPIEEIPVVSEEAEPVENVTDRIKAKAKTKKIK